MIRYFYLFLLTGFYVFLLPSDAWATHNRAGEIAYRQIDELTIEVTVTTYTKASSTSADRDSVQICWGDEASVEDCQWVLRSNGNGSPPRGQNLANDTKLNLYIATHTYPGRGHYKICLLYTSPSPRDLSTSRMPSSA